MEQRHITKKVRLTRLLAGALVIGLGALGILNPGTAQASTPIDLTGSYSCQFKGEKLELKLDHSAGQLSVTFLVEGAVYEEELYLTDGGRHSYREPGRAGTYEASSDERGVRVVEYMGERVTNQIDFTATKTGLNVSVKSKNRKISCKRNR